MNGLTLGLTSLLGAYQASGTAPHITLDSTRGGLAIRDAATPLGAVLFELTDNAGTGNFFSISAGTVSLLGGSNKLALPLTNDATSPTIQFGDGDTGIYESSDDALSFAVGGIESWRMISGGVMLGLVAGGNTIYGGTAVGDVLTLQGNNAGSGDVGIVQINSPVTFTYDAVSNTTPVENFILRWEETLSTAAFIGGMLTYAPVITVTGPTFIPAVFSDTSNVTIASAPGFSAVTFINHLGVVTTAGAFNLSAAIMFNGGPVRERTVSGTSVVTTVTGFSFTPQVRTTISGAVVNVTNHVALSVRPTFSTVVGSTSGFGTVVGVDVQPPGVALFQPGTGTETMTAQYGLRMRANTFATSGNKAAVFNEMTPAADRYVVLSTGGAKSDWGGGDHFDCGFLQILSDTKTLSLGAAGGDVQVGWNGSAFELDYAIGEDFRIAAAVGSHTITSSAAGGGELRFGQPKIAFGQTGAVGNQKMVFVANAETVTIGGEYSQYLLTQAANDTINAALSLYAGWTINTPSPTIGTGSITTVAGLNIGGNASVGTNRVGLRILSNPTGGGGVNAALWVTAGNTQLDGDITHTGTNIGFYGATPVAQSAAYTRNAAIVEDRTLLASASATTLNNNNVLAALIADLQAIGILG